MYRSTMVAIHQAITDVFTFMHRRRTMLGRGDNGQSTAEYALVLLGAAAVALAFLLWATRTDKVGDLFNDVLDSVIGKVV